MNTRTPQTIIIALLAALPALRVLAQQPAAPAAAEAAAIPPAAEAASAPAADPVAPAADAAASAVTAATRTRDAAGRDTLSVDFPDEDIRNILRNVADLFELNIIMPDTLQGKTTIKLRDVTWRQIFQSVLQPVNFTYLEEGNIIKIVSAESLLQEPLSTEVFLINYAKASDILPTVTSLVDAAAGGKIVVDVRSNSLVITERPTRMNRIRPIIEQLDRATDQVMIESKFVEVTDTDVKNIGVNWSSLAGYKLGVGNVQNEFLRGREQTSSIGQNANNRSSQGSTNDVRNTSGTTRDTTQSNGSTTASTVTASGGVTTTTSTTGTTGSLNNSTAQTNGSATTGSTLNSLTNTFDNLNSLINSGGTSRALSAVFSADDFSVVLSALQSMQKTKVVSNPTIVTLNNTQAVINVGQERPIPNYTYNTERGVYEVSGFTYRPIGVILKVTPQVNSRGYIKLTVEPEVSQSNRDANFNGAAIPIVESRKANTTVSLRDGFTMGIGGLLQSQSNNGSNKVPVLGSIPVLGRLFKSESRNADSTNLIIFITAKTISAEGATVEQVFDSERVRGLDLRREDLPGHRDGSNPFISSMPKTQP
jgi:type II secretory pathway component GspD/PulD (secretin)